jgi:chromosome segregation ATPase
VRFIQGEVLKRVRGFVYQKKFDQRELIKVGQRNFRKFLGMRDWGWFIIIQKTRGSIGQPNPQEELEQLEAKASATWGKYDEQLKTKDRLLIDNVTIKEESKALLAQLESEQGNLSVYHDKQAKASSAIAGLEVDLTNAQEALVAKEASRQDATADKKLLEQECTAVKKDIEDVEMAITKVEQEKTNRDHTIRSLNDEIANQDEVINKLNKEKKHISENAAKSAEDLGAAEDKVAHLNQIKSKLESTLDELESSLEKEKRGRANVEKERRKVEGDLKVTQESVADQERTKKELESSIERKEKDASGLLSKLDDEQSLVAKIQKGIKENQAHVEELEEELEAERQARAKAERQRSDLARELENMGERLGEASGATSAQIELNKKREAEVTKLRRDLEEAHIQQEATLVSLKKKHQDAIAEMTEQIEQLNKMKNKVEKDKTLIMREIADARAAVDEVNRSKAASEKSHRNLLNTLNDQSKKIEEATLTLNDMEGSKRKIAAENADLLRQLQEMENAANMLSKLKLTLADQLDEARAVADHEAKERQSLLGKFRNAEHEVAGMQDHYQEEVSAKENLGRSLNKALGEADMLRVRYEKEGVAKAEELEMAKLKMQARLSEADSTADQLKAKLAQLDKARAKLASDLEAQAQALDQAQILNLGMEKKAKQFDRIVGEWKSKVDSIGMDLDSAQKETRNASSELFRVKSAYEEAVLQLDEVRRENKNLSNEIKDIMDQISEGGRSIHEIDKICKRLEAEKMELEAALSEAEGALEQEENKVLRAQLELAQVRQEIERRIAEKEEEFASTKKNMGKGLESMQAAVETEAKGKAEALRMKKKLEGDVLDLDCNLEHANAANAETQRNIKTYQLGLREAQAKLEGEQLSKEKAHDALIVADRKCNSNQNALEEARTLLEQADRARRMVEQELADTNETLSDQTCQNQAIQASKMKIESEMGTLSSDLDEMAAEAGLSEEKAQRAMIDAARLADELRGEQDAAQGLERERKLLDAQVKDMQSRVDEAQTQALKGGKKAMTKMDTRIRELESELDAENRRMADAQKNMRKSERKIKELSYQQDEDRKNHERMQGLIDQLQGKIKSYKKQIEEAEEIAALNLAKYRQAQNSVSDATERADSNEQALAKNRARARSASIGPM